MPNGMTRPTTHDDASFFFNFFRAVPSAGTQKPGTQIPPPIPPEKIPPPAPYDREFLERSVEKLLVAFSLRRLQFRKGKVVAS